MQLDHEVWTQPWESVLLLLSQYLPAWAPYPSEIRGTLRTIRESESGGRIKAYAGAIGLHPCAEQCCQSEIALPCFSSGRRHDHQVPFARAFKAPVRVKLTKLEKFLAIHFS